MVQLSECGTVHTPKYRRMGAEEFRTNADNCQFPQTKATLREVADNYDELARRAEGIVTVAEPDGAHFEAPE